MCSKKNIEAKVLLSSKGSESLVTEESGLSKTINTK